MANPDGWLEHTVQVQVERPVADVWRLWSDLEQMPNWMQWIQAVQVSRDQPGLSSWVLGTQQFHFTWRSRVVREIPLQLIQWEAIDGLPNRGAIRFYDRHPHTIVKMTVAYAIPGIIGQVMDRLFLGRLVESTLQADLNRFRNYAVRQV
ncbi:MAG: SRPBCC family protein [Pseudanabaenaceae cyanobacterium SKYGB_i_bin29]|nr:SRPBCC family protein [Pseudanabaenaceae cyanobacterium SKYG29]MDW8420754.1 SRPBCC family protein [Pseudanabaenaceae cyanobacterium SKYGB_i_bin29]